MNNTTNSSDGRQGKDALRGKHIEIRPLHTDDDTARFNALCGKFHYMGEGRPAGDTLRMAVVCGGEWVALLLWGSAAYRLKDRDEFIGWNNAQRAGRFRVCGGIFHWTGSISRPPRWNSMSVLIRSMFR